MKETVFDEYACLRELEWDTKYFGLACAKAVLYKPLTIDCWNELKRSFRQYQFVCIENRNSEPINAQLIGRDTSAFLADVNIQFSKRIESLGTPSREVTIHNNFKRDDQLLAIADYRFSRFVEDPELLKRGGDRIYQEWIINSFGRSDKYFAIFRGYEGPIKGFILHSYTDDACIVELIAVSNNDKRKGIGSKLIDAVEQFTVQKGIAEMKVGTQLRNTAALNFYHKTGFRQVSSHQIYHLWNS